MSTLSVSKFPNQQIEDYKDDDYIETLRFLASRWNFTSAAYVAINAGSQGGTSLPSLENTFGFVYRYLQNVTYLYGSQVPTDFSFFVMDENGQNTRIPMYRGQDIPKFFNFIIGKVREMVKPLPKMINVIGYSDNVQSSKKVMMDMITFRYEQQEQIKNIQLMTGLGFEPMDGIDYDSDYDVSKRLESFKEVMEVSYENIAKDITYKNQYITKIVKGGEDIFISGIAMMCVENDNNNITWRNVKIHQAIFDNTSEDTYHLEDTYAGEVIELTINDILTRWEWTEKETEDIKAMATNPSAWSAFNTLIGVNGMYWWSQNNGVPKVTCVKGQWRSMKKKDGVWIETLREGILIGNKYLKDNKESEGQVWDIYDKRKKRLKYRIVTPNSRLGSVQGIVGMIKRLQDLKDGFITKCIALASSAVGKSYFVNANKLPDGLKAPDIISQLKQANIIVLEGADIDETPDSKNQKVIESIDMTIDPSISLLLQFVNYFDQSIADILNIPNNVRGAQTQYQSKDVYASNLTQAEYGMMWFYDGIMGWVEDILSYSANLAKVTYPENNLGKDKLSLIVGDVATELLSMEDVRKIQFEDFLMKLVPNDVVSEQEKQQYMQLALQLASTGMFTMRDYIKLKRMDNLKQMEDYFEVVEIRREQREKEAQQAQIEAAQANSAQQAQSQENVAEIHTQGALESQAMKQDAENERMANEQQSQDPLGIRR